MKSTSQQIINQANSNGYQKKASCDNFEKEFQIIKNKKNFTVAVRIKPEFNAASSNLISLQVKKISSQSDQLKVSLDGKRFEYNAYGQSNEKKFTFDKVYESESKNQQIFTSLIQQKLQLLEKGVNLSIMAYGATNSGKTYTIFGKKSQENEKSSAPGLSFLSLRKVFEKYCEDFNLNFSFVQIYNQNVYDLLSQNPVSVPLNVMQNSQGNTNVIGLNKVQILSAEDLQILINQGNQARISCNNVHNMHSSRSHAFMELQLRHKTTRQRTKVVIVDLAGSEKYIYNALNGGALLKQGSNINKSLLSLGNCIKSLYENDQHVPYRDSKLTRLLKENLNGYAHNIMIACINMRANNFDQNLNSLNYASKAIKIEKQIVRKIQSQQISEYQCTNCLEKLPYSLIKEINKHEDHKKRVKTRQSQSLSISPIAKNSSDLLPFKSFGSSIKSNAKKFQRLIEQSFESIKLKICANMDSIEDLLETIEEQKKQLKRDVKQHIFNSKTKNQSPKQRQQYSSKQILVSEFQSPSSTSLQRQVSQKKLIRPTPVERKVKISLSKPRKQLQNTATTIQSQENCNNKSETSIWVPKYNSGSTNHIKIEDDSLQNVSDIQSFRSNLTVEILDDKQKILNERKQVLEQVSNNQRRKSSHSRNLVKFKSTQNTLKNRAVSNFISKQSFDDELKRINLGKQNFIKIEEAQNDIQPFQAFIINQRLLDSTSVAPRMRRDDEDEITTWKNIVIRNVESPTNIFSHHKEKFDESLVQETIKPNHHNFVRFNAFPY